MEEPRAVYTGQSSIPISIADYALGASLYFGETDYPASVYDAAHL